MVTVKVKAIHKLKVDSAPPVLHSAGLFPALRTVLREAGVEYASSGTRIFCRQQRRRNGRALTSNTRGCGGG